MKKFVVLLVVVAMTLITAMAYAADVTVGGTVQIRSRDFSNMDFNDKVQDTNATQQRDTQERIQIDVNAKAGDVKGKISLWNDFETWGSEVSAGGAPGSLESEQGQAVNAAGNRGTGPGNLGIREAWVNFNLPGIPVNVTAGHQLLSLGNGWFFRNMHFGSDAWVIANQTGNNTAAFVNVKVAEFSTARADDVDAYVLLDVFKLNDANTVGVDLTMVKDRAGAFGPVFGIAGVVPGSDLENLGLNYNGKLGPLALKAQFDIQMGKIKMGAGSNPKFKGNEIVLQGAMAADPVTVNVTLARGTGSKASDTDIKSFINFLDVDPHYTFLYEYKVPTAAGAKNTGFSNTTALGVGATFAATKSLNVGADLWILRATQKVANVASPGGSDTNDMGTEIDLKLNWNVAENLSWNWVAGLLKPGDGLGKDNATGIQGILAFKF